MTTTTEHVHLDSSAIAKLTTMAAATNALVQSNGLTHLLVPNEYKPVDLTAAVEAALPVPSRKKGTQRLSDLDSFLTYVEQQGAHAITRIYADTDTRTLTAIFNDHANVHGTDAAGWRDHRAVYTAELSKEFENWMRHDGEKMGQEDFAVFLEDNIADVVEPSGDTLLQVALTLQAKNSVNFSSSRRLDNGQVQLEYTENLNTTAGTNGNLEVPREFAIGARLFKGGEGYRIRARLKLRVGNGTVKFWYELDRPHVAIEDAFTAYVDVARNAGFTLLMGKV